MILKKNNMPFGLVFLWISIALFACKKDDTSISAVSNNRQFGVFEVLSVDTVIEMNGTINSSSLDDFNRLELAFPNVKKINIKNCDGSSDDDVNLKLSLKVHQKGISIHLLDQAEIASGGVDFFLAGTRRTRGDNIKVGVHSWSGGNGSEATDFPVGHVYHLPYINYYKSIGFTQQQAEDFYYFTINSASADNIHWMTEQELQQYNIFKS